MLHAGLEDPTLSATCSTGCKSEIKQLGDEFEIILGALVYDGTADDTLRDWVDANFDPLIKAAEHAYSERYGERSSSLMSSFHLDDRSSALNENKKRQIWDNDDESDYRHEKRTRRELNEHQDSCEGSGKENQLPLVVHDPHWLNKVTQPPVSTLPLANTSLRYRLGERAF